MILPKYKISWDDITNIYNDLNIQRARFAMAQVAVPTHIKDKITTEQLNNLVDSVEAMSTNSWIGQKAETGVVVPNKGNKIKTIEYNLIRDTITTIGGICPECTTNYTTHRNSDYGNDDGTDFGGDDGTHKSTHDYGGAGDEPTPCSNKDNDNPPPCSHDGTHLGVNNSIDKSDVYNDVTNDYNTENNIHFDGDLGSDYRNIVNPDE